MTSTETKKKIESCLKYVSAELTKRFETCIVNGKDVFVSDADLYFRLFSISDFGAVGVEYAQGKKEAELNRYEDGDLFYLDEYDSNDALLQDILLEIEG